ncbi:MAG TPA: ATP-binding protein [Rhodoblastus sp.]|nr:ATP-binding protein [Rhodoblastus sp.]
MSRFWRWLRPDSLGAQIALVLFVAIALFQIVVTSTYLITAPGARPDIVEPSEIVASAVTAVDVVAPERRPEVIAELAHVAPWLKLTLADKAPAGSQIAPAAGAGELMRQRLWPGAVVRVPRAAMPTPDSDFAIELRQGGYLVVAITEPRRSQALENEQRGADERRLLMSRNLESSAALFLVSALLLTIWLTLAVIAPLYRLVRQAEKLPLDRGRTDPIKETGPREMRELSRALNRMQRRIDSMIESRSRALAAISHDLRTIITRMRLRSEFIVDEPLKAKMQKDVETMDSMLHKNLVYLRGEQSGAGVSLIDLDSVLQTIADEFADLGHDVSYSGGKHQTVYGSIDEMQRLFSNLVENAVTHGQHVIVSASAPRDGFIVVDVADDGPGIAEARKEQLLEPFVRGEPARTVDEKGGFGLGLSIVASLTEKAGGKLQLLDRTPSGLVARVALPAAFS